MKMLFRLTGKTLMVSLLLAGGIARAESGQDGTYKNMTLEQRLYLFDGYGSQWAMDVGSDGLWFVPKRPTGDTYNAPLKLRNAAAANTLVIGGDSNSTAGSEGYVGIGTNNPKAQLDVRFNAESHKNVTELVALAVNNTDTSRMSDTGFKLSNTKEGVDWTFRTLEDDNNIPDNHDAFAISKKRSGAKEMIITANDDNGGMKLILANGAKCVGGQWVNASSRKLKENIKELSATDALNAFRKLKPVTYDYKIDKKEKVVGFIAEDVPELVAMNSRDGLSPMDIVATLTKVVQVQDKKIAKLEAIQKRLAKVESLLTNLALDTSKIKKEKISLGK